MEITEHPFFRESALENSERLVKTAEMASFDNGEVIFEEGSDSDSLCLVLEGRVDFCKRTPDGQDRIISHTLAGNFFGEIGIFTEAKRSLSAVANGPVRVGKIHRDHLVEYIRSTPGPIEKIMGSIVNHLHDTTRHYVDEMLHQEKMSLVGTMMNSIIHDFKNPFTMISLGAQLLEKKYPEDDKTLRICKNINEQISRMLQMANELAEFSRGEQQKLYFETVSLDDLCASFYRLNEPFFDKANVKVSLDVDPVAVQLEPNKMIRVLQNLVGNAIEAFGKEKTGHVTIALKVADASTLRITVADNAGGIPEEIRETLFQPFVTFGKSKGTGLGAAIVKSIVEAHGGSIDFETQTGQGTTFTILLPREQSPNPPSA